MLNDDLATQGYQTLPASDDLASLFNDALRYMRMSTAAYGTVWVNPVMFPQEGLNATILADPEAMIIAHARLQSDKTKVVHAHGRSDWLHPSYYVLHDTQRK